MATVYMLLARYHEFQNIIQERADIAENRRHERFIAVLLLQRMTRGYLIRKHVAWLSYNALIIQCAFRKYQARKDYREALKRAVRTKHAKYYARAATRIQASWRGYWSRKTKFCYRRYRRWLRTVTERGERRAAEAAEFTIRSRADDLRILEEEARQWLAYVVFKLHHLLRTYSTAGVYSDLGTNEYTEFEQLIGSIKYMDYMKKLRRKYAEFVKKYKPQFSNKRLFPIIGEGADYWYLSLPEMYQITIPKEYEPLKYRHVMCHHGKQHKEPFLWRKVRPPPQQEGRGPFTPSPRPSKKPLPPPPPTPTATGDICASEPQKDPRFYLYVKYYKPQPELMDYIDFQINLLLKRQCSIEQIELKDEKRSKGCRPKNFPPREK